MNHNVPKNVQVLTEIVTGEVTTTYYIDREGGMWKVGDWVYEKPIPVAYAEVWRVTGIPMIVLRGMVGV